MTGIEEFAAAVNQMCAQGEDSPEAQGRVLDALRTLATTGALTTSEAAPEHGAYTVHQLHADPNGWTVSAVVLPPGRATPPHDHACWGCAAPVRGVERHRRFTGACPDRLHLESERLVSPGDGYLFAEHEIHQCVGAAPHATTISLHFIVRGSYEDQSQQVCQES